jgi:transposase
MTSGKYVAEIKCDLGINDNNLYRWRILYGNQLRAKANENVSEMEAELKRLRRENEVLRQKRDILKKAMSIVNRSQS